MKTRILTMVATLTLLSLTSGCGVLRQFWFGRGARCGVKALNTGPLNQRAAADCGCAPAGAPAYVGEAVCGHEPVCGYESYGGVVNDPYLSGPMVGGGVMGEGVVVDGAYPSEAVIGGENWVPRAPQNYGTNKFDTDGARIINELPPGVTTSN